MQFAALGVELRVRVADAVILVVEAKPAVAACEIGQDIRLGWRGSRCKVFAA